MFHELLGLGLQWEVVESRETAALWQSVHRPQDSGAVFCCDHTGTLTGRHLNVFRHRCGITCRLPRGQGRQCGHALRVRPPWEGLSTHFTREFEAFALLRLRQMPMSKVAALVGETDTRPMRRRI